MTDVVGDAVFVKAFEALRLHAGVLKFAGDFVVQIDAAPFRQWYEAHYGSSLGRRRQVKAGEKEEDKKKSNSVTKKQADRLKNGGKIENAVEKQFEAGRLYAAVSSRPGQSGRCDGYVLEGEELAFYQKLLRK